MSLSENNTNLIKVPFPPSISVDKIIQMHLKNGIKNVNETMNAFMIYRNEFNYIHKNFNFSCKNMSKLASKSWRNELEYVKDYYKQLSKEVKEHFKKIVPTPYFINRFRTCNRKNNFSQETNPPMDQTPPETIYSSLQFVNMEPINQISPEITCYNSLLMNTEQNSLDNTTRYNSPPSNSPETIYSGYQFVNRNMGQNSPDATYSNLPVGQYPLENTFLDLSNMDQIFPGITSYSPFISVLSTNYVDYSNSLGTIYSSQNYPNATNSNPPMVQTSLEITFPDPPNMNQISPDIDCYFL